MYEIFCPTKIIINNLADFRFKKEWDPFGPPLKPYIYGVLGIKLGQKGWGELIV